MNIDYLIKMINQIGTFYAAYPDKEQAVEEVASHLRRFWDVRMRARIIEHVRNGGQGVSDMCREAVERLV